MISQILNINSIQIIHLNCDTACIHVQYINCQNALSFLFSLEIDSVLEISYFPKRYYVPMLWDLTASCFFGGSGLSAGAVGEDPLHQAALQLPRGGDHVLLRGDGLLDRTQRTGDPSLLRQGREGNWLAQHISVADRWLTGATLMGYNSVYKIVGQSVEV